MGAWGTGPLENDEALDFHDAVRKARKGGRLAKAVAAIDDYLDFDRRLQRGENVTVLSDTDIAALWKSRDDTLALYREMGRRVPRFLKMDTEAEYAQVVAELAQPQVDDGSARARRLMAVAQLLADALEGAKSPLSHHAHADLVAAADACAAALDRVPENALFVAQWRPEDFTEFVDGLRALQARLAAAA